MVRDMAIEGIDITERAQKVLRTVVDMYLERAEPVGSRNVAKRAQLGVSPATIRNVMADLEDIGLLYQPHTSAGRLPTEKGLIFYINNLLEKRSLAPREQEAIRRELELMDEDIKLLVKRAVDLLARVSGQAALGRLPAPQGSQLLHVEFVRLSPKRLLVVSVYTSGLVHNRVVRLKKSIDEDRLLRLNRYLNEKLRYMDVETVRKAILQEMQEDKRLFDSLMEEALDSATNMCVNKGLETVIVRGTINLLDQPEFRNVQRLRHILQAFEDKKTLVEILDAAGHSDNVTIVIGDYKLSHVVPGCCAVVASFQEKDGGRGSIGILGPLRMDYGRVMSLVEYTAKIVGQRMNE